MKPISLTMQAFGPYAGCEKVDFSSIDHGLFLVCGPTGSGKTTIFDAIKYALYGELSTDARSIKEARSQHAEDGVATFVELVFEHDGHRYRAYRSPAQERPKKRGTGTTSVGSEAYLEDLTRSVSLASKDTDVTKAVTELFGIDSEQFARLVMISQNDFASVLNANTKERETLFRKIFGTGLCSRFQETLEAKLMEAERRLETLKTETNGLISRLERCDDATLQASLDAIRSSSDPSLHADEAIDLIDRCVRLETDRRSRCNEDLGKMKRSIEEIDVSMGKAKAIERAFEDGEEARAWLSENDRAIASAQEEMHVLEARSGEREELQMKIRAIDSSMDVYTELDVSLAGLRHVEGSLKDAASGLHDLEERISSVEDELGRCRAEAEDKAREVQERPVIELESTRLQHKIAELEVLSRLFHEHEDGREGLALVQEEMMSARKALEDASSAFQKARFEYDADLAGILAESLEQGRGCPVCGSSEHPSPAVRRIGAPAKEDVDGLSSELDEARSVYQTIAEKAASMRTRLQAVEERVREQCVSLFGEVPDDIGARIGVERKSAVAKERELQGRLEAILKDEALCKELADRIASMEASHLSMSDEKEALTRRIVELDIEKAKSKADIDGLKRRLEHPDKTAAMKAKRELESRCDSMRRAYEEAKKRLEDLLNTKKEKEAKLKASDDVTAGSDRVDISMLEKEKEESSKRNDEIVSKLVSIETALRNHENTKEELSKRISMLEKAEEECASMGMLARLSSGKTPGRLGRVTFESFVQTTFFNKILKAANERLSMMSSGRYDLVRRSTALDKRSNAGLDIDVLDRYTGSIRTAGSLSGGETFMASLSLALGLSDVIMEQAGGMHLDAMFVDEGFGSLDDETCQLAINVLNGLSGDDRMIGIISHVAELKDRIPRQIRVKKSCAGSTLEMDVA